MTTLYALDVVKNAMTKAGILAQGEPPSDADAQFVLGELNSMLDQWNARRIFVYALNFAQYTLVPNLAPHTIGPTGTFTVAQRPVKIVGCNIVLNNVNPPVKSPVAIRDADWWNDQLVPSLTTTLPTDLYYDPLWPNGALNFWPIPTVAYGVLLELWVLLSQFAGLAGAPNQFSMPPGYWDAIQWSLAEMICPSFGKTLTPEIVGFAMRGRRSIQMNNDQPRRISTRDNGVPLGGKERPYWNYRQGLGPR